MVAISRNEALMLSSHSFNFARSALYVFLAALIAIAGISAPANAEGRCPPGYYPTGGADVGWFACAPMGPTDGNPQGEPDSAPGPIPDAFMSVIAHPDASVLWATSGYDSGPAADKAALQACQRQMGKGCYALYGGYNAFVIVVAQDVIGHAFAAGDVNNEVARSKALASCQQQSVGCEITKTFFNSTGPKDSFPTFIPLIRKYAVVAWTKAAAPAWRWKTWLVSGISGLDAAVDAAVKRCATDTGMECVLGEYSGSGILVHFADNVGATYWTDAANEAAAPKRVALNCPKERQCRIIATYAADELRTSIIEEDQAK